jgi:hypothetical protein
LLAQRQHGSTHRRSGRETVVHEDRGASADRRLLAAVAIQPLAALELALLPFGDRGDRFLGDFKRAHQLYVEHSCPTGGDRAHRQLLVSGDA